MNRHAVVLTVAACVVVAAWAGAGANTLGGAPPAEPRDAAWVGKRVDAWQPTREERAFDEIGWAKDFREAERLGKQHGRPVFLFTYDGASLSGYRC